jgi:hypothetical protein
MFKTKLNTFCPLLLNFNHFPWLQASKAFHVNFGMYLGKCCEQASFKKWHETLLHNRSLLKLLTSTSRGIPKILDPWWGHQASEEKYRPGTIFQPPLPNMRRSQIVLRASCPLMP